MVSNPKFKMIWMKIDWIMEHSCLLEFLKAFPSKKIGARVNVQLGPKNSRVSYIKFEVRSNVRHIV
jgi:biotin synthase-related radical SAM superfamily protein